MRHYPIFLDLQGRTALVLGEGEAATRKAEALQRAGAEVRRAARFIPTLLDGCAVAVGTDAEETDLASLSQEAQRRGIPVNIVDRPALCSFITPSVIDRDPLTVAVSSGNTAPVLARLLRSRIEAIIPPAYGRLAALADRFKEEARRRLPDMVHRRRMLERVLNGRVADLVFAGQETQARIAFAHAIEEAEVAAPQPGVVFLVGAGPGAADLLTLRAQRLLGEADVIVHDRLVGEGVLDLARRDARRIYVGKARANHCLKQEEINDLLVRLAREGQRVVRLKGGDPFVFGRGGEEAEALATAGIACEVVPGITAALACAAQAGIALTHRDAARMLTFVTGHTKDGVLDVDFATLAHGHGTIAVYMGLASLPALCDGLTAHGMAGAIAAALIERGGSDEQRLLKGTVATLPALSKNWGTGGPTLVLIGPTVSRGQSADANPQAPTRTAAWR